MGFLGRLFGKKASHAKEQEPVTTTPPAQPVRATTRPKDRLLRTKEWDRFFDIMDLHESAEDVLHAFVGYWPREINPHVFAALDRPEFFKRIKAYQNMSYPLRSPFFPAKDLPRPTYKMVRGQLARESTMIDMIFMEVIPKHIKHKIQSEGETCEPHQVTWLLIEHYSNLALARLLFILPFVCAASDAAKENKAPVMVIEDTLMQVYKGVENVLFDVYSDLPEGGVLSDAAVKDKLKTLLDN